MPKKREALIKAGWDDVIVLDAGDMFHTWDHVKTPKKDGGRVYVEIRTNGEVTLHEGFITRKEHDKRLRKLSAGDKADGSEQSTRPELTAAAQNYVELHRHAAVRHALLSQPQLALRLTVAHMIGGSALWRTQAEPQKADKEATADSLAKSKAQAAFEAERTEILKLLGMAEHGHTVVRSNGDDYRVGTLLVTLLTLSDADVMRILTYVMAETLQAGTCVIEQIGNHLNVDRGALREPDDAFFELIRDKAAINAMLKHVGGKAVADGNVSATAKVQKKIIRDFLTGEGREKKEGWLPKYMTFPFAAYTKGGAGKLSEAARAAKQITG